MEALPFAFQAQSKAEVGEGARDSHFSVRASSHSRPKICNSSTSCCAVKDMVSRRGMGGRSTQLRPQSKKPTGVGLDEQEEVPLILSPCGGPR